MCEMEVWYWNPKQYHDPDPDPDSEQNFDLHKNFAERHQIWWISLAYKE